MRKAYRVHDGEPFDFCLLVYAETARKARQIAGDAGYFDKYIDIRAERLPEADKYAKTFSGIENGPGILRELGWHYEGDLVCDCCGLYEMDGLVLVCGRCCRCAECSCNCINELPN